MNSTIVTEHKCGSLSVGVDAADAALKSILPGSENKKGANEQHKGRERPNARAGEHNDRKASHSATTLLAGGAAATTRRKFNMFPCTQLRITFRRAAAVIACILPHENAENITCALRAKRGRHQRQYYIGRASRSGKTF